jgi:hypothetical protein
MAHSIKYYWAIPLAAAAIGGLAAIGGGIAGSQWTARLTHQQWRFEQVTQAYAELSEVLDEAILLSAEIPARWQLRMKLAPINPSEAILETIRRNPVSELAMLVVRARAPCLLIGNFAPDRAEQATSWIQTLDSLISPLLRESLRAAGGDTVSHRLIQKQLESLRTDVVRAHETDVPVMSAQLAPWRPASFWITNTTIDEGLVAATLVVALLSLLANTTDWFRRRVPIACGFVRDDELTRELHVSTGDPAKVIVFGFQNQSKSTLADLVLEVRLLEPLSISGTNHAIDTIPEKTEHWRDYEDRHYLIRHWDVLIFAGGRLQFRAEVNTQTLSPGTYKIAISVSSRDRDLKTRREFLTLHVT